MDDQLEHFVNNVGGCGMFQVVIFALTNIMRIGSGFGILFMSFGNYNPGWTCVLRNATGMDGGAGDQNITTTSYDPMTVAINQSVNLAALNHSQLITVPGSCDIVDTCVEIRFNPEASTIVTEWGLICDRSWISSLITSLQMVGIALGAYFSGRLADRYGRKISVYSFIFLGSIVNGVAIFSVSWKMFATMRFLIGISVGGCIGISLLYPVEFVNSRWRTGSFAIPTWDIVSTLFGLTAFLLKDWRHIHIAITAVCALSMLTAFWLPESMRWLVVHGKQEKVKAVARKICRYNRKPPPKEEDITFKKSEVDVEDKEISNLSILLRRPLLKRVIFGFFIFFTLAILYYGVVFGIQVLFGNFYLNFIVFSLAGMPAGILVPLCGNYLGRRWGTFALIAASGVFALIVVILFFTVEDEVARGWSINIIAILTSTIADAAWGLMITFTTELFPTNVRATGYSVVYIGARLGGIVAPYALPKSFDLLYVPYIVMMVMCVLCCAMVLALPETKDAGMEGALEECNGLYKLEGQDCDGDETTDSQHNELDKNHTKVFDKLEAKDEEKIALT